MEPECCLSARVRRATPFTPSAGLGREPIQRLGDMCAETVSAASRIGFPYRNDSNPIMILLRAFSRPLRLW